MKIFGAPSRYVQASGLLDRIGDIIGILGDRFFILADEIVLSIVGTRMVNSLERSRKTAATETFEGECCYPEILRLTSRAEKYKAQVIIGAGGGKALDTAKALNVQLNLPVVIIPTIASTDGPGTHLVVVYDENHVKRDVLRMKQGVSFVLVDNEIIAQAPARFLVAGMGDAISTKFEAEACWQSGASNLFGGKPSEIAVQLGQLAYDIVRKYGEEAKDSVNRKEVTPALEKVIEANVLLSGLGAAGAGAAAAHAIYNGFKVIKGMDQFLHGEIVAFGVLIQMVLENRPLDYIREMIEFYMRIGLPKTLVEVGLNSSDNEKIEKAVSTTCEKGSYIHNMPFAVNKQTLIEAILKTDHIAKDMGL